MLLTEGLGQEPLSAGRGAGFVEVGWVGEMKEGIKRGEAYWIKDLSCEW